ncbi:MAG: hypothetical protein K2K44_00835, partial [Oscillospiraceae bacterium]|nr:hypothetical protein [Oscillospiraceae bacterium]
MEKNISVIIKYAVVLLTELILLYAGNAAGETIEGRIRFSDNRIKYHFDNICTILTIAIFIIAFMILTKDFFNNINSAVSISEKISEYNNKYFIFTAIA